METDRASNNGNAALWASAFLIGAMTLIQIDRKGIEPTAKADLVSNLDDYTILTFDAGSDDYIAVLDSHSDEMFVYSVHNRKRLKFVSRYSMESIFRSGRRIGSGQ